MLDYWRLRISDTKQIYKILQNPLFKFKQIFEIPTSEIHVFPQFTKWENWEIKALSPTHMQISGSIHKYYHRGTNATDFTLHMVIDAINKFCEVFGLDAKLAVISNLEFGLNFDPGWDASFIINQILCFKNTRPIRPYENRPNYFFIEFDVGDYYLKVYDKGKQYGGPNLIRVEIKGVKNRFFAFANIKTLHDLLSEENIALLAVKINQLFKEVVFDDTTINYKALKKADMKNYLLMKDANEWSKHKKVRTSTHRNRQRRFKQIVYKYGKEHFHEAMSKMINEKLTLLTSRQNLPVCTSKYMVNNNQELRQDDLQPILAKRESQRVISGLGFLSL